MTGYYLCSLALIVCDAALASRVALRSSLRRMWLFFIK